ncbi:serine protease [Nocardia abscessus]|uniref:S1 family peptidase n=1 Tax=Nocardia abscessus TaxID=120957 RepID=UPI0018951FF1|nr:serine protease [Nocardia abscessus]MBF6335434.1 serine protease [Nocardia abscessus]
MRILRRGRTAALAVLIGLGLHAPASAIVGGADATTAEYPWLAAVGTPLFLNRASGQFCGGALIAPDQVITAAHCVALTPPLAQTLTVTFGRDDLRGHDGNTVQVRDIRIHPGFRVSGLDTTAVYRNDVAILTLDQPQPGPTVDIAAPGPGAGTILGWGATSETGEGNARLHAASVPLVNDAECAAAYGSAFDPYTMLCAGSPTAGATQYDSGGPLLVDGRLTGLISWGEGTARPGFPDVYTRLTGIEF